MKVARKKLGFIILDLFCVNISLVLAFLIQNEGMIPQRYKAYLWVMMLIASVIAIGSFHLFQLYNSLWKYASLGEMFMIGFACLLACGGTYLSFRFLKFRVPFGVYMLYGFMIVGLTGLNRLLYRAVKRHKAIINRLFLKGYRRIMIVGAGEAGAMVIRELQSHPEMGMKPIVAVDDNSSKHNSRIKGVRILGGREAIPTLARDMKVDEIMITIPSATKGELKDIIEICKGTKCKLRTLPNVLELIDGKVSVHNIRDIKIEDLLGREPVKVDLNEISEYLHDEVVLVTGGGGSIGSELCRQIAKQDPKKLLILDIYENGVYDLQQELGRRYPNLDQRVIIASVRERARMEAIFEEYRPGVVFHAAAHKHVPLMEDNPAEAVKNNVFGTLNTAECADKYGARRFVLISTDKAVNPTNIMGATKRIAEMIIQALNKNSKTEFVAVRFGNVLGSNGSVIPLFEKQIAEGGPVTVTHPEINRFFMIIPEAVQLVIQAGAMAEGGEIFILDMGQPVKIADLAEDLIKLSGLEPGIDIDIEYTGLRPGEKLYEELLLEEEGLMATRHEKIFIGKPSFFDLQELKLELETLKFTVSGNGENIFKFVQHLVPNYRRVI
ncbi:MAG TPA: nucleoside-diphosphate sugar epimerase/dehydratase [Clostridia bacterium]|nr:nucleoside-diphosphate sugar epimerase/dehydratase [Clostridia bacterium]